MQGIISPHHIFGQHNALMIGQTAIIQQFKLGPVVQAAVNGKTRFAPIFVVLLHGLGRLFSLRLR